MKEVNVIIIGAGPAGLMAANLLNTNTLILEKNKSAGKKLLISGQGQCNFTHDGKITDFFEKYGENNNFVKYGLSKFTNKDAINFFNKAGVEMITREDGKVFPKSLDANEILEALLIEIYENKNKEIKFNQEVIDIAKEDNKFIVKTSNNQYKSNYIIVATGGRSYVRTGSSGDGYNFADKLGIEVTDITPGLCKIIIKDFKLNDCAGIAIRNTKISHYRHNSKINEFRGDLLITHKGLSGPIIINNSRYFEKNDKLYLHFIDKNFQKMDNYLIKLIENHPKKNMINIVKLLELPENLIESIYKDMNLDKNGANISKNLRKRIVKRLINYKCIIESPGSFKYAMVTVGGVNLKNINKKTMESRSVENLFFIGEVLDIDGDTGGYNIQWAFSSAYLASNKINNKK